MKSTIAIGFPLARRFTFHRREYLVTVLVDIEAALVIRRFFQEASGVPSSYLLVLPNDGEATMMISIQLAPEFEQRLTSLTHNTNRTMASFVQEIIEQGIDDIEDRYLANEVLQRVRRGQEKTCSSRDVRRIIGLDN